MVHHGEWLTSGNTRTGRPRRTLDLPDDLADEHRVFTAKPAASTDLGAATRDKYQRNAAHFLAWLGEAREAGALDGDPLTDAAARDWSVCDYRRTLKNTRTAQGTHLSAATINNRFAAIRRFLPKLLRTLDFDHGDSPAGADVIEALDFVQTLPRRRTRVDPKIVPTKFLTPAWRRRVFPTTGPNAGEFDPGAYTVAVAERLRESLRRHEVFVPGLAKWGDPTTGLLTGPALADTTSAPASHTHFSIRIRRSTNEVRLLY